MRLIDRKDIERWANQFDSKGNFPILISRLVHASTPTNTYVDFPSGNAVFTGSWDGLVNCQRPEEFVPEGLSLWELGTEENPKGKADKDYEKRTSDPDGYDCNACTFVFVTPRFWNKKDKWRQNRLAEGKWKDIRVYDSSILEQWLDNTAAVSRWFSSYLSKYPLDGIITTEEFWKEWSLGPLGTLPPEIVTAGRLRETDLLQAFLSEAPGIKAVQAASKDEATAFIIAAAKAFEEANKIRFLSRTLIIDTSGNFRSVRINTRSLNLIARFDEPQILYAAAADGHHVIVPLGPEDTINQEPIILPTIDRNGQITALKKMGLVEYDAEKMSKEAGRNVTILKRLLQFPQFKLPWLTVDNIREILPALLIGRWDDRKYGDHALIEALAGEDYSSFILKAAKWQLVDETPIVKIGEMWRLLSPLDAWTILSQFITSRDIELFKVAFLKAYKTGNPPATPKNDHERYIFAFNREKTYSNWVREGILQSLILIGLYGDNLKLANVRDPQRWVDKIIYDLLFEATGDLWVSLDREMPLLAEASPESFLDCLNNSLLSNSQTILSLFNEEEGLFYKSSHHSGLLWALESLAWMPEHLSESSLILAKLSEIDPGGQLSNRPFSSLVEIFRPWHYQTLASFNERITVLKRICDEVSSIGWRLLIKLLPQSHGIAQSTHKMRWRVFNFNFNLKYTYKEIWETHDSLVNLLSDLFNNEDKQLSELLSHSVELDDNNRDKIFSLAKSSSSNTEDNNFESWKVVKDILSRHRSHPETDWALSSKVLDKYQDLFDTLAPTDLLKQHKWLFDDWPNFPEGNSHDEKQDKKIILRRNESAKLILENYGIDKIIELCADVKEPWALGNALANSLTNNETIKSLLLKINYNDTSQLQFIQSFLGFESKERGLHWTKEIYRFMEISGFQRLALVEFLSAMMSSDDLWDFIDELPLEIKNEYWLKMRPWFFRISSKEKIRGIQSLIKYKRFFSAIVQAGYIVEEIPSQTIIELLESTATIQANEQVRFDYHLDQLLDAIQLRNDVSHEKKINIEWLYMPMLVSYRSERRPKNLHAELSRNPQFFVEILTWLYMPKNRNRIQQNIQELTSEMIQNRAESARLLLDSWQEVPGMSENFILDESQLKNWVEKVRELAANEDRTDVADSQIGQILAKFPEISPDWPPQAISSLIEEINSESLFSSFSVGLFNKRGSSSRGVFDGGDIERQHESYFIGLFQLHKTKHRKLARIFKDLSVRYGIEAQRMDEEAKRMRLEH